MRAMKRRGSMRGLKRISLSAGLAAALAGCSMTPDYETPDMAMPAAWDGPQQPAAAPVTAAPVTAAPVTAARADWWSRFGSAELDGLMSQALAANQDLEAALQVVDA